MNLSKKILDKNLMILASAGSGKTYQLGNRIVGLIGVKGVDPERMVALTFTRKAAGEFADSVLTKLAKGVVEDEVALQLFEDVEGEFSVVEVLEKVVEVLPRFQLGTIDSFFSRIVRGFQYELGLSGGEFSLIEGAEQELAMRQLLQDVLSQLLDDDDGEGFIQAFRRATMGKEELRVLRDLEGFIEHWHGFWKAGAEISHFGEHELFSQLPKASVWEEEKFARVQALRESFATFDDWPRKGADIAVEKMLDLMEQHTIGSGVLTEASGIFQRAIESIQEGGPLVLKFHKEFEVGPEIGAQLEDLIRLVADCELSLAVERTRGIGMLIQRVDEACARTLRDRGLLSFDDVKILLGSWKTSEEARLNREMVDFRLDGRYDHWFLDEFQDTSPTEWDGLSPLINEAASEGEGSLFIVGDKKQAIYGWRGGDVRLFDQVQEYYERSISMASMEKSYRSCPAVLDLVNQVCGDSEMITRLFGASTAERWQWRDHEAANQDELGEARVEISPKDKIPDLLVERLREIGVGERKLQCGILVRTGKQVATIAEHLRSEGFSVIEEGRRKPMEDSAIGVAVMGLISWLADPADRFARQTVKMSPLESVLQYRFTEDQIPAWEALLEEAYEEGFAMMVERLVAPLWKTLSPFDQRRLGDLLGAFAEFEAHGGGSVRALRDWLERLEISQAPGEAAVQVMTIHKSKGLGFDVVMLPNLSDEQVPSRANYTVAHEPGEWLLQPPASWVRALHPQLLNVEERWVEEQQYEALCLLYVALTRAKRGLYLFLAKEPGGRAKAAKDSWTSPANLVRQTVGESDETRMTWWETVDRHEGKTLDLIVNLGEPVPMRERLTPSSKKTQEPSQGMTLGGEVHALFESIEWLEPEEKPKTPKNLAGMLVDKALAVPEVREIFEKKEVQLYREQAVEVMLEGKWLSGKVDRMHLYKDYIEIFDFKIDRVENAEELISKHRSQLAFYEQALTKIYQMPVRCYCVSTHLKSVIKIPPAESRIKSSL